MYQLKNSTFLHAFVHLVMCKFLQYLGDIEEHLGIVITQIDKDLNVPCDEFDGKVVYGKKRTEKGIVAKLVVK